MNDFMNGMDLASDRRETTIPNRARSRTGDATSTHPYLSSRVSSEHLSRTMDGVPFPSGCDATATNEDAAAAGPAL